jgi:hypothetical protein
MVHLVDTRGLEMGIERKTKRISDSQQDNYLQKICDFTD